jgi:hypothetical protein
MYYGTPLDRRGQERAARFVKEDEALNFIKLLRLRHGVQAVQLLDAAGLVEVRW